jgi:hypothetical protein
MQEAAPRHKFGVTQSGLCHSSQYWSKEAQRCSQPQRVLLAPLSPSTFLPSVFVSPSRLF